MSISRGVGSLSDTDSTSLPSAGIGSQCQALAGKKVLWVKCSVLHEHAEGTSAAITAKAVKMPVTETLCSLHKAAPKCSINYIIRQADHNTTSTLADNQTGDYKLSANICCRLRNICTAFACVLHAGCSCEPSCTAHLGACCRSLTTHGLSSSGN